MPIEVHTVARVPWLDALVEVVAGFVRPLGFIGPLGYRWWEPGCLGNAFDGYQLAVYPTPNEIHGGQIDGARAVAGFCLDVGRLASVFAPAERVSWSSPCVFRGDLDGPEVSIEGSFAGKRVWLRVFTLPPPDEPPSFVIDPQQGRVWAKTAGGGS